MKLEQIFNFRDLGGMSGTFGRVKSGFLFRSGHHGRATEADLLAIAGLRPRTYVDLRSPFERQRLPNRLPQGHSAKTLCHLFENPRTVRTGPQQADTRPPHMPPELQAFDAGALKDYMIEAYRKILHHEGLVDVFKSALAHMGELDGPVIIHCHAGKDRTGVLVALILHALGVSFDDIGRDYLLTNALDNVEARFQESLKLREEMQDGKVNEDALRFMMRADLDYLMAAFEEMKAHYGSAEAYGEKVLGLTPALRLQMRQRILET